MDFTVTLQNTADPGDATPYRVASLFYPDPNYLATPEGELTSDSARDGEFPDANGNVGLIGSGSPNTLYTINEFLKQSRLTIKSCYIQTDNAANLNYTITVKRASPFRGTQVLAEIVPARRLSEWRSISTEVTLNNFAHEIGGNTWLELLVKNGTTLNLSFEFEESKTYNPQWFFVQLMKEYLKEE